MVKHWADRLWNSSDIEDVWAYRVACYWQGASEDRARKAARICIETPCCVWHAVSIFTNRLSDCQCSPCRAARR